MKIFNGMKIAAANKTLCYKTLLYKLVISVISILAVFSLIKMIIFPILASSEFGELFNILREVVKNFILMEGFEGKNYGTQFQTAFSNVWIFIKGMNAKIIWGIIGIFLIVQLVSFILALGDYVIGVNIYLHMTSLHHAGFFNTLLEKFKMACKYAGYKTISLLLYNAVFTFLILLVVLTIMETRFILSLMMCVFLIFVAVALRLTICGALLAKMVCEDKSATFSFKECFTKENFKGFITRFISYFVACFIVYVITIVSAIVTFGVSTLITMPLFTVTFITLRFVDYFTVKHNKYYITFDEIVIPKELRKNDEILLNKVDI